MARGGFTASSQALDGPQGFIRAMDGESPALGDAIDDLGRRWEILKTGITIKLYPSCAGTHPALDAIFDLRRRKRFGAEDVERIDIDVDSITPTILIYERPATGLEAKFSMPFCAAAAIAFGQVDLGTFDDRIVSHPQVASLMTRVAMQVDPALDGIAEPLTQAKVNVRLRDGRVLTHRANGARGYPEQPASDAELDAKFMSCAQRTLPEQSSARALRLLRRVDRLDDIRELTATLVADKVTA